MGKGLINFSQASRQMSQTNYKEKGESRLGKLESRFRKIKLGQKRQAQVPPSMWKQLNTVFVYRMIKIASEGLIFQT